MEQNIQEGIVEGCKLGLRTEKNSFGPVLGPKGPPGPWTKTSRTAVLSTAYVRRQYSVFGLGYSAYTVLRTV